MSISVVHTILVTSPSQHLLAIPKLAMSSAPDTTIGKYIARFRQEKPRPREERVDVHGDRDFWWVQSDHTRGVDRDTDAQEIANRFNDSHADTHTSPNHPVPAWEEDLLSDGSSSIESTIRRRLAAEPSASPYSSSLSMSLPSALRSSSESRLSYSVEAAEQHLQEGSIDEHEFVFLPANVYDPQVDAHSHTTDGDVSLEDPEIVIQRIRRRLGYQPPPPSTALSLQTAAPSPSLSEQISAYSPLRDDQLALAELQLSSDVDVLRQRREQDTPCLDDTSEAPSIEDFDEVEQGVESPLPLDFAGGVDLFVLEEVKSFDSIVSDSEEEQPPQSTEEHKLENADMKSSHLENADMKSSHLVVDEANQPHLDTSVASLDGDQSEVYEHPTQPVECIQQTEEKNDNIGESTTEMAKMDDRTPEVAATPPIPSGDRQDKVTASITTAPSPKETKEKQPRLLPPLSPARSPMPSPIVRSGKSSPVPAWAGSPSPSLTTEAVLTLDSLLSSVVHSWGDNMFGDSSDEAKAEDGSTQGSVVSEAAASTTSDRGREQSETAPSATPVVDSTSDSDDEESFSDDPVVTMLTHRLAVYEQALEQLQVRDAQSPKEPTT